MKCGARTANGLLMLSDSEAVLLDLTQVKQKPSSERKPQTPVMEHRRLGLRWSGHSTPEMIAEDAQCSESKTKISSLEGQSS